MPTALITEDDRASLQSLTEWITEEGFEVHAAESLDQARRLLDEYRIDLALLDLQLPDGSGIDLLDDLENQPETEVVMITGHGTIDSAVAAMRGGAVDYLTKPVDLARLKRILQNVLRTRELRAEVDSLREELRQLGRFGKMIGSSSQIQRVYDLVTRVAPTDSTVLISGETGTGKELVAHTIHELSRRSKNPFLPINCGAVAPNLIESELFGHERGSFTGADRMHKGIFEQADGGTLFLDEITEMPWELQVKLLRVLETGKITRVGSERPRDIDVRVITATNRDPSKAVAEGKLRQDLLYRLLVFPVHVPPLKDRGNDVDLLAQHFLGELNAKTGSNKRFHPAVLERFRSHPWPGNVRELRNVVERAFIMAGNEIGLDTVPLSGGFVDVPGADGSGPLQIEIGMSIAEAERRLILATLDKLAGDKKGAAETLGISLKTLYNRLKTYGPDRARV